MPIESALVVLIPEAEVLVEKFRLQYDPSAAAGVPAHVTILYPFKPPSELTADIIEYLSALFLESPGFEVSFAETRQFPGVLYLAPTPDEQFRSLIQRVTESFPETPPYGGRISEIIPHLTIADVSDPQLLEQISREFEGATHGRLPFQVEVSEIALLDNEPGRWRIRQRFPLAFG